MFYFALVQGSVVIRSDSLEPVTFGVEVRQGFKQFCEENQENLREALIAVREIEFEDSVISFDPGVQEDGSDPTTWVFLAKDGASRGGCLLNKELLENLVQKLSA